MGISGRAAELNASLDVGLSERGGVNIPWAVLAGPQTEKRAQTTTTNLDGGVNQLPILQRLFGIGVAEILGVKIQAVPAGRAEWPLITNGVVPSQVVEGTAAADAVAVTFAKEILKPKRLTGQYAFSHELSAQVPWSGKCAEDEILPTRSEQKCQTDSLTGTKARILKTWTDFWRTFLRLHPFLGLRVGLVITRPWPAQVR